LIHSLLSPKIKQKKSGKRNVVSDGCTIEDRQPDGCGRNELAKYGPKRVSTFSKPYAGAKAV
jgi:hypothetical protein